MLIINVNHIKLQRYVKIECNGAHFISSTEYSFTMKKHSLQRRSAMNASPTVTVERDNEFITSLYFLI